MKWALIVILIVIAVVVVRWKSDQYKAFVANADKTTGMLVRKEARTFRPNQQTGKENWIIYTYFLDGKNYSGEEKVEYAGLWHDFKEGQRIGIYYNKSNPGESHAVAVLDKRIGIANTVSGNAVK